MDDPLPRFEFRVWGHELSAACDRLRQLAEPAATLESRELYVVAEGCDDTNAKIRNEVLDVKILQRVVDRCEQWQPWIKAGFPIAGSLLGEELLPRLGVTDLSIEREVAATSELIALLQNHPRIGVARVSKQRTKYIIPGCLAEQAIVTIDGHRLETVAIESADVGALGELRSALGLESFENVSYPRAIKLTLLQTRVESELRDGH
jgi:hypothetical protein